MKCTLPWKLSCRISLYISQHYYFLNVHFRPKQFDMNLISTEISINKILNLRRLQIWGKGVTDLARGYRFEKNGVQIWRGVTDLRKMRYRFGKGVTDLRKSGYRFGKGIQIWEKRVTDLAKGYRFEKRGVQIWENICFPI